MFAWISANLGTIAVCLALAAAVAAVIAVLRRDRKKGVSPCGGKCGSCPMGGSCHEHQ